MKKPPENVFKKSKEVFDEKSPPKIFPIFSGKILVDKSGKKKTSSAKARKPKLNLQKIELNTEAAQATANINLSTHQTQNSEFNPGAGQPKKQAISAPREFKYKPIHTYFRSSTQEDNPVIIAKTSANYTQANLEKDVN